MPPVAAYRGNQAALRRLTRIAPRILPKLEVSAANDPLEAEADSVADHVMRMPDPNVMEYPAPNDGSPPRGTVRRMCSECKNEEDEKRSKVQRKATGVGDAGGIAPESVQDVIDSPGRPLGESDRAFFEPRFGLDFSDVRIHDDARAAESARSIGAHAYAYDSHIAFSSPMESKSITGRRLLAHELTHVAQQNGEKQYTGHAARHSGSVRPQSASVRRVRRAPTGGNILYIGMNNYAPEVQLLNQKYARSNVKVTTVTVTEHEEKTQAGGATYDLTQDSGIKAFVDSLHLAQTSDADKLKTLISSQSSSDRDDLVHVISVYAQTEADGIDRMSRVVLSGHSYGILIYNEDAKGKIMFNSLVTLAGIFPKAAGQTKHLLTLACLAGEKDTIDKYYVNAFPNLRTFWGWTQATCPTGAGAATALSKWTTLTDKDPTQLPMPPQDQANWAAGNYQTSDPVDATVLMAQLNGDEAKFQTYFSGDKTDPDAHAGFLFEYYQHARTAAIHTSEIKGADHDFAQLRADWSYRLRFWPGMVSNFWKHFSSVIQPCYGSATPPDFPRLSRKAALAAIAGFSPAAGATGCDNAKATSLLNALKNLDANVLEGDWIKP